MRKFELSMRVYDGDELTHELSVEFVPVEGTSEHQPVVIVRNVNNGLDATIKLPQANYRNTQDVLEKLMASLDPNKAEKLVRKLVAILTLMK